MYNNNDQNCIMYTEIKCTLENWCDMFINRSEINKHVHTIGNSN